MGIQKARKINSVEMGLRVPKLSQELMRMSSDMMMVSYGLIVCDPAHPQLLHGTVS